MRQEFQCRPAGRHGYRVPPAVLRKPLAALVLAVAALAVAAPALAGNGGFAPVPPESPNAQAIEDTYWVILAFTAFIFVLVEGALIYFVIRYRRRGRPAEEEGPQIRGHNRLELAWTVAPVLILVVIGTFVFYTLPEIQDVPSAQASGDERLEVVVEGRQFYFNFTLSERRRRGRPPARPGEPRRPPRADLRAPRRDPQLVDPGTRRQDGHDPRAGPTRPGSRPSARGSIAASARSSAESSTQRC